MLVLLDTCIHGTAAAVIAEAGHGVIWVGELPDDPGDDAILDWALREGRVLVTLDKDFGELAVVHRRPHAGIVRLVRQSAADQGSTTVRVLREYQAELLAGAILTVEPGRVRIRPVE